MSLTVNGHTVHLAELGAGDAPTVMIHCSLARHEALLPLARALAGPARLFDLPGHGRSADWDGVTAYQRLVTEAATACCTGPTHVIGHSFGATAALRLAVERPDLVSRLTLIEPVYFAAARGTSAHEAHRRAFQPFTAAMLQGDEARAAALFHAMWGVGDWDALHPRQQAYLTARIHLIVAGAEAIEADHDGITSPARLAGVQIPVTLIAGAESPPVIGAIHACLAERLPRARAHVIAGAGHMAPLTHAEALAAIIRSEAPEIC